MMKSQRIGKYACLEIEYRYLVSKIPHDLFQSSNVWLITDRYFPDTRMRLRHMQSISGDKNIYKLTQKYRDETQTAYETTITNIYLNEMEFIYFKSLDAKILTKRRYPYQLQDFSMSIDVFEGPLKGLTLAEIEIDQETDVNEFTLPPFVLKNITDDPFFTGGNLVTLTNEDFQLGYSQRIRGHNNNHYRYTTTDETIKR